MLAFNFSSQLYLDLLDALQQSAIATKPDGTVVGWNRSAEALYGWKSADAVGRNIVDLTPALVLRDEAAAIMTSLAAGRIWSGEFAVRTRDGDTFRASITDVPIVDEFDRVIGIVGVSARANGPASLSDALLRFGAACAALWPGRVDLSFPPIDATLPAGEPHVQQLLALLVIRYTSAIESGLTIDIDAAPAGESIFSQFGVRPEQPVVYIRFRAHDLAQSYSIVNDEIGHARPTNFAAALVRILGGWLFLERAGKGMHITHLLLPTSP